MSKIGHSILMTADSETHSAVELPDENGSRGMLEDPAPKELISGPTTDEIASRAYFYWLERGSPEGSPDEDWFRAERDLGQ